MQQKIGFIGAGNMASSIIGGLIKNQFSANDIWISDHNAEQTKKLKQQYQLNVASNNIELARSVDTIILAVKPQIMKIVCQEIASQLKANQLFISIAAGLTTETITSWLGNSQASFIRCMPNTPALLGYSATGLFANTQVSSIQKEQADNIMDAIGINIWVENEQLIDSITAVSGSGPAYFFLMMEAMIDTGIKLGLSPEMSQQLVKQTALGASMMINENSISAQQLRKNVTSPGGTTEQAINSFQENGFEKIVEQALSQAQRRAGELSEILSK